jgi:2-methylcitrate dehydratase MmgE/PrpD-like protein
VNVPYQGERSLTGVNTIILNKASSKTLGNMSCTAEQGSQPVDLEGPTGKLCNWVHNVKMSDIPSDVQTRAKYLVFDGIACLLVGAHLPWSEKAANAIFEMDPPGSATIFGYNRVSETNLEARSMQVERC